MGERKSGSGRKRSTLTLLGFVCLIGYVFFLIVYRNETFFLSPKTVRVWGNERYQKEMLVHSVPSSSSAGEPNYVITDGFNAAEPHEFLIELHAEDSGEVFPTDLFHSDESGVVSLPGGSSLALEGSVLSRSWLADWSESGSGSKIDLNWRNPYTGEPLNQGGKSDPSSSWGASTSHRAKGPELFLFFRPSPGHPVSILGQPAVFDSHSRVGSGYRSHRGGTEYSIAAPGWHRHSLEVVVDILYGEPVISHLPDTEDEVLSLGGDTSIRMLREIDWYPGRSGMGSSLRPDGKRQWRFEMAREQVREHPTRSRIYGLWPPKKDVVIELRQLPRLPFQNVSANGGVFWREGDSPEIFAKMEIRKLPHRARLVFPLPEFTELPEVNNQFETPIPNLYLRNPNDLAQAIRIGAGVKFSPSSSDLHPSRLTFPLQLTDTNPMELIRLYETMLDLPIWFDRDAMTLEVIPRSEGILDKVAKWWRGLKRSMLP